MDYSNAMQQLLPSAQWTCGETYASIVMLDATPKPTKAALIAASDAWDADAVNRKKARIKAIFDKTENDQLLLRAIVAVLLDEVNVLRANAGLTARTPAQVRTAIFLKLDD